MFGATNNFVNIAIDKLVSEPAAGDAGGMAGPSRSKRTAEPSRGKRTAEPSRSKRAVEPSRSERASEKPPRRRRDAEEARAAILDAAERRLVEAGPAGIRLQDVASDVGVSHPTVLHHFGSREGLVNAVVARSFAGIHEELVETIGASAGGVEPLRGMLDAVAQALSRGGHGRVLLWLALEGHRFDGVEVRLSDVVDAAHALRTAKRCGDVEMPSREDTARTVVLAALALISSAVLGPTLLEQAGLAHDEAAEGQFRAWLARVLVTHLESGKE